MITDILDAIVSHVSSVVPDAECKRAWAVRVDANKVDDLPQPVISVVFVDNEKTNITKGDREAVAPMLRKIVDQATQLVRTFSEWLARNKEIAVSFTVVTTGAIAAGAALSLLGAALATVATILTPLTVAATGIMIGIGAATSAAIGMIGTALTATVTAVAAIPGIVGAAVTAIAALGGAVVSIFTTAVSAIMGITIDDLHWGHSYGEKTCRFLIDYAFRTLKATRLSGDCFDKNIGSRRLMEKCGFELEGRQRRYWMKNGEVYDNLLFGLIYPPE